MVLQSLRGYRTQMWGGSVTCQWALTLRIQHFFICSRQRQPTAIKGLDLSKESEGSKVSFHFQTNFYPCRHSIWKYSNNQVLLWASFPLAGGTAGMLLMSHLINWNQLLEKFHLFFKMFDYASSSVINTQGCLHKWEMFHILSPPFIIQIWFAAYFFKRAHTADLAQRDSNRWQEKWGRKGPCSW